jgi:exopolyphosphatase / guanosine-5'-triphosphate,3'-diphosphate pyrophosphatase
MTVAAIDCGTNTVKLLIGDLPDVAVRETRMVRLGQDVDRTGRLADEALARAFAAIDEYAALIEAHDVERLRFCATSATRDAANAQVFSDGVFARLGVRPEVLTGSEEAAIAFDGAVRNLAAAPDLPVLVIDVGGGSTELILGDTQPRQAHSMDIGSVRLHERHLHDDPPTAEQVAACVADIDATLDASPVDAAEAATVVGVSGTVTTVAAGVLDLASYDREAIDQQVLRVDDVLAIVERIVAMPVARRLELPYLHPGRADVIDAGALILSRVLRRARTETIVVSESDILDGIAWSLVGLP